MIRNNLILNILNQVKASVPSLAVSPTSIGYDVEGGFVNVSVDVATSSQVWAVTESISWISVTGASLVGDDTMRIICDAQPAGEQPTRSGSVTYSSSGCGNVVVNVSQAARPA